MENRHARRLDKADRDHRERVPLVVNRPASLTARAAAAVLGISEWTVRRAIASGELTATKRSGAYRITPAALAIYRRRLADRADAGASTSPLPDALTSFLGRRRERQDIRERLAADDVRLLTLTGPGGVGKTRLALQVAADIQDEGDDVRFVPLDAIDLPERVLPTIAQAMGVRDSGNRSLLDAIAHACGHRRLLLVLDNVEHVVDAARDVAMVLARCPRLRVLATSRVRLRIDGEHDFPVLPLDYPDPERLRPGMLDAVGECSAVALFVARARAANPDFALTDDNLAAVVGVCARLDGLPLAIELAAARARMLSPAALLGELSRSLPVLTGAGVGRPARHQTLRDTIAWSYDRLAPGDQAAFRRLAVCQGGFGLDLASALAPEGGDAATGTAALDAVQRLVEHSLVQPVGDVAGRPRFAMLETIREFALERLAERGEEDAARRAHATWALAFAERNELAPYQLADEAALRTLGTEQGNLDAALEWAQAHAPAVFVKLVAAIGWVWWVRRYRPLERTWLERASDILGGRPLPEHGRIMAMLGFVLVAGGDLSRARACFVDSLATYRALGDETGIAHMLLGLGVVATYQGQYGQAAHRFEDALRQARAIADARQSAALTAAVLRNRGVAARDQGRLREAEADLTTAFALERETGSTLGMLHSLADLGDIARDLGDIESARGHYLQGLRLGRTLGETRVTISVLEGIATVLADRDADVAARLLGAADRWRRGVGVPRQVQADERACGMARDTALATLGEPSFAAAWATGEAMMLDEAIAEAERHATRHAAPSGHAGGADRDVGATPDEAPAITAREIDVLHLLAAGLSDRAIAERLYISVRTAENHVRRINRKLGTTSRTEAVAAARAAGLLRAQEPSIGRQSPG